MDEYYDDLNDVFNQEIARELLLELDPDLTDTTFDYVWSMAQGNPWNCPILFELLKDKHMCVRNS